MDIHKIKYKKIRDNNVKLVFFNKTLESSYSPRLVDLVTNSKIIEKDSFVDRWFLKDKLGNEYKIKQLSLNRSETDASFKLDKINNIFSKSEFEDFCINNKLPIDSEVNRDFFNIHIEPLKLIKKTVNFPITVWNIRKMLDDVYSAAIIINSEIVGCVLCEILTKKEIEDDDDLLSKNMNLYISNVDIRPDYQGFGLCRPLLSYTIANLKSMGFEQLFIFNASRTKKGIPACICYYRAGIENSYRMRSKKLGKVTVMTEEDCFNKTKKGTYYYMSDQISKRTLTKIKKTLKLKKNLKL